jgi:hypothetical protein
MQRYANAACGDARHISRAAVVPGEIRIGDRAYLQPDRIANVLAAGAVSREIIGKLIMLLKPGDQDVEAKSSEDVRPVKEVVVSFLRSGGAWSPTYLLLGRRDDSTELVVPHHPGGKPCFTEPEITDAVRPLRESAHFGASGKSNAPSISCASLWRIASARWGSD